MTRFRQVKTPVGLATFGAFFVPEPLGACFVLAAAIWWSCRKLGRYKPPQVRQIFTRSIGTIPFRAYGESQ